MFASIPNFTEFYSEDINKGMECIRLLNEIIGECYDGVGWGTKTGEVRRVKSMYAPPRLPSTYAYIVDTAGRSVGIIKIQL